VLRMTEKEMQELRKGIVGRIPVLVTGVTSTQSPWEDWKIGAAMHRARELFHGFDQQKSMCVMEAKQEQESFELLVNLKSKLLGLVCLSEDKSKVALPCSNIAEDVAADLFELRSALIAINTPLVFTVTNKWREKFIGEHDMEDRCSLCSQILIKCVDLFNPFMAIKFSTFAVNSMQREVFRDQERCNKRKTRFRLRDEMEMSIKPRAQLHDGDDEKVVEVERIISRLDGGKKVLKSQEDDAILLHLIAHLRAGGTVKTFEKEPGVPEGRIKEVLIRVRNQFRAA